MVQVAGSGVAMAALVWDLQRCTCCRCGSLASTPGCSSFEPLEVAFPGGGLQRISSRKRQSRGMQKFSSRKRHSRGMQLMSPVVTRSLYSPLVESLAGTQRSLSPDMNSFSKSKDAGAWNTSLLTTTSTEHYEQSGAVTFQVEDEGKNSLLAPQDPLPHGEKLSDIGHDIDMRRSMRARPPSMSLSQGFSSSGRRSETHTVGAVGYPVNTTRLPRPIGFAMAFVVAALGLKTAAEKQGFLPSTPQKVCEKCDGYGVQLCHVCQGRGVLTWEGKLRHTDPCPLCFGNCLKKCSSCGGVKIKKGVPPAVVTKLAGSNRK
ncbi:hypothetical protein KC19_8G146600 [Ceratodon purpureus]|uniref:Uncharacterized protein n=1 Tax=Ceratodon purpureus TaxID=3225 RepID=A0A8T0GYJ7_CERPU|nr:hypothetical protein KC19_8G146600 [Ceratodon purpureus]